MRHFADDDGAVELVGCDAVEQQQPVVAVVAVAEAAAVAVAQRAVSAVQWQQSQQYLVHGTIF
jgi:hypothetical protein